MDSLIFERVWQDVDFFKVKVTAASKIARAVTESYTTSDRIIELSENLTSFPQYPHDEYLWENGKKGVGSTAFVSLRFFCKDKLGHVIIEVYMELDDGGGYDKHFSCFYINTEIGLLNAFGRRLSVITTAEIGKQVWLHQKDGDYLEEKTI